MPADPVALAAFAHRLLCAAAIAHGDPGGRQALRRPGSPEAVVAIERLVRSPDGRRLATFVEGRGDELAAAAGAGDLQVRERIAIWSHAVADAALDAARIAQRLAEPRPDGWHVEIRNGRAVFIHPRAVLTAREFALLRALTRHAGLTLTREQLREHAWPEEPRIAANTVDVYVGYLRRKLGADTIATVRNVGYRVDPETVEALRAEAP